MIFTYEPGTDRGKVRLLLNDVDDNSRVFFDEEIDAFLDLSDGAVLLAAAQAIETNADNEILASKVLRTQDLSTDGAKVSAALLARAQRLRDQADSESDGYFDIVELGPTCGPELAERGWY